MAMLAIILSTSSPISPFSLSVCISVCLYVPLVALARLFTGRPALRHVYATGQMTLSGSLERVSGLRSKVAGAAVCPTEGEEEDQAATTTTIPTIIIPSGNTKDHYIAELGQDQMVESYRDNASLEYIRLPKASRDKVRVVSVADAYKLLDLALMPLDKNCK